MEILASDLRRYSYFSSLSDDSLEFLAAKTVDVRFAAGSEIVKEGTRGDHFYFVRAGRLEVTKKRTRGGEKMRLAVIDGGHGFGEMALLTCSTRSGSVQAMTDVALYQMAKADFEGVILKESVFRDMILSQTKDYAKYNRVKTLQPFELLSPDQVLRLMERLNEQTYWPGQDIIVQKERGDTYYIIKAGRVAVLKKGKGEQEYKKVAELGAGEAFGEEALIRDDPRNATCRAIDETTVYVLNKRDFDGIVKSAFLDIIYPDEIRLDTYLRDYIFIDARIQPEYDEEHIFGAINIPVEVLRQQSVAFDKAKKYITYCLNDSRGMVAAFLLKNRGFDAKCLRGGVGGWPGPVESGSNGIYLPEQ